MKFISDWFERRRQRDQQFLNTQMRLAAAEAELAVLRPLIDELRAERNGIQDRFLTVLNLRPIHQQTRAASPSSADSQPVKPVTSIRDWVAAAQSAEDKAFSDWQREEREDALKQIREGTKNNETR